MALQTIVEFFERKLGRWKDVEINIGIRGYSGVGRCSFINAISGLAYDDEGAAKIGVTETTREAPVYSHPTNEKIKFWFLPGIGTPTYPDLETYCEKVELETYDTFLILTMNRFTQNERLLADKVKSLGKSVFFIRTHIDVDYQSQKRKKTFNEDEMLKSIREDCFTNLKGSAGGDVFLISNLYPAKWDFALLTQAILDVLPLRQRECLTLSLKCFKTKLGRWKDDEINIGIRGDTGVGRSSFINAIRGLADDDEGAAMTGVTETTREKAVYSHPTNEKIKFWVLPGIGTPNYRDLKTYCEKVELETYDIFLILTGSRFTQSDRLLADKVKSLGKSFFFIRTKIDEDFDNVKRRKKKFNEDEMLKSIRENCFTSLKGLAGGDVFLISNLYPAKWDFARLIQAILDVLSLRQRECLTLSLGVLIKDMLTRKAEPLRVSAESWKWKETSIVHREKFIKLREYGKTHPEEIKEVHDVRVCCSEEFLIGKGTDGTRVYVGLGKDGYERAVKRLPRDACAGLAEQEKKILNELNIMKSNYTVRYWYLDEQSDKHYLFLILDLCEETLENFVSHSTSDDLLRNAPGVTQQILKGLADLHRDPMPILHRDLKPTNILRNVQGNWLLADFGISRILMRGASTHSSNPKGTEDWRAVESYPSNSTTDDGKARYKKESDIQVAGIVAFYIVTKGEHPFGSKPDRLRNLLDGKPVGLDTLKDPVLKDLLSWMLSLDPKDRPSAEEALKHPYLQPVEQQFKMLCQMGNQQEIKAGDVHSPVVQKLNKDRTDWRTLMKPGVLKYLCTDFMNGRPKIFEYKPSWTECLRLMRNVNQHWHDRPRPLPQPEPFYEVGDPQKYFLNLFPNLPVEVHRIVRSCDWKERPDLKEYFIYLKSSSG